jgi:uncharacterized protein (TIGR02001 family)
VLDQQLLQPQQIVHPGLRVHLHLHRPQQPPRRPPERHDLVHRQLHLPLPVAHHPLEHHHRLVSGVDFNNDPDDTNLEVDLYGGYAFEAGGVGFDIGAIYYAYPDSEDSDLDFWEVYGAVSKEWGAFGLGGSLNWDPDNETVYADISGSYALTETFSVDAGYGTYLDGFGEYAGWNVGGTLSVHGVDLGIRFYDNDMTGDNDNVIFSIGKSL